MQNSYLIHKTDLQGSPARRYWKLIYTAALRLGEIIREDDVVRISFTGEHFPSASADKTKHDPYNERFLGTLFLNKKSFQDIVFIHTNKFKHPKWVTFWPKSEDERAAESTVEPLIKLALEGEAISATEVVTEMHPEYIKNPGIDPTVLLARAKNVAERDATSLIKWAESWKDEATAALERGKVLEEENTVLEGENKRLLEENERLKREKAQANAKGKQVTEHQGLILKSVETDIIIGNHLNTVLHFENGSRKTIKVITWDKDLSVTKKAQSLIGRRVMTTCWDPKDRPGIFSNMGYFNNIYEVD